MTPSRKDAIPEELEDELRRLGCHFIQSAGILLKLYQINVRFCLSAYAILRSMYKFIITFSLHLLIRPQVAMATAQVLFQRFYYVASMMAFSIRV